MDLILALVLGEPHEPSALIVLERLEKLGEFRGKRWQIDVRHEVIGALAFPRSSSLCAIYETAQIRAVGGCRCTTLVDITKVGYPALEVARDPGLRVVPVMVGKGTGIRTARRILQVGKAELVSTLGREIEGDKLKVVARDASELAKQLANFTVARRSRTEQPVAQRDELVVALALGIWWSHRTPALMPQSRPPIMPPESEPLTWDSAALAASERSRDRR